MSELSTTDVGALLAAIAHDLRTPLATIYGFAKTIERTSALGEREARFLGLITEAAHDLDQQLVHVSTIAHMLSGRAQIVHEEIRSGALAIAAVRRVQPTSDGRSASFVEGVDGQLETDPERAAAALALLAEAVVRLEPSTPEAIVTAEAGGVRLGPVSAALGPLLEEIGRDVPLAAAQIVLGALGARISADGSCARVTFPVA